MKKSLKSLLLSLLLVINSLGTQNINISIQDDCCSRSDESDLASQLDSISFAVENISSALDSMGTCPVTLLYNVPGGQTLTKSGRYCLAEDILVTGTVGIIIDGSGITLDLNGHSIILTGSSGEIGIAIATDPLLTTTFADIRIKNGTVINSNPPVYVSPPPMTIPVFSNIGISAGSGDNVVYDLCIEDVTCVALDAGISLNHTIDAVVDRVKCDLGNVGLFGTNQVSLLVQNSLFNNNVTAGFAVVKFSGSSGNSSKVIHCGASNNGIVGFVVVSAADFLFQDCFAAENQQSGFIIVLSNAISLVNCLAQSQDNSTDLEANGFLVTVSTDIVFRECSAINNKSVGFNDNNPANQYYSNYACGNGTNYSSSVVSAPVTSPANARGVYNVDCSNSAVDEVALLESTCEVLNSKLDFIISYLIAP